MELRTQLDKWGMRLNSREDIRQALKWINGWPKRKKKKLIIYSDEFGVNYYYDYSSDKQIINDYLHHYLKY